MNDYIPFMDKYPELKLVPTTSVSIGISHFKDKYDYVQDLNRKGKTGSKENFHLLVKNERYGVLLHFSRLFGETNSIALPAVYDSIEFIYKRDKAFGAIIQKNEKFGLYFWAYGTFRNDKYMVAIEYDSMVVLDNKRIKAIKDDYVTYFDETGHILK